MPIFPRNKKNKNNNDDDKKDSFDDFLSPFDDFFSEIDDIFDKTFSSFSFDTNLWNNPDLKKELENKGHVYYGYSARVGSDGKPNVKVWSNIPNPEKYGLKPRLSWNVDESEKFLDSTNNLKEQLDPNMEVIKDPEKELIKIIIELPGVKKEDLKLKKFNNMLILKASCERRSYYKEIALKEDPESIKTKYNNGVLEITIKPKKQVKLDDTQGEDIAIN